MRREDDNGLTGQKFNGRKVVKKPERNPLWIEVVVFIAALALAVLLIFGSPAGWWKS